MQKTRESRRRTDRASRNKGPCTARRSADDGAVTRKVCLPFLPLDVCRPCGLFGVERIRVERSMDSAF